MKGEIESGHENVQRTGKSSQYLELFLVLLASQVVEVMNAATYLRNNRVGSFSIPRNIDL